jgi:AcrR family transcriptional regulator
MTMENFFRIRAEKQDHIINAGFTAFGKQGYRKASIGDIAKNAGTTKGMITYYFGSKKNLYIYLLERCQTSLLANVREQLGSGVTDFFERFKSIMNLQLEAIRKYPGMLAFANGAYYETEPEVADEVRRAFADEDALFSHMLMDGLDLSWFKPGFDPDLICKFMLWAGEGFSAELFEKTTSEDRIETMAADFEKCLDMMRRAFHK